VRKGHLFDEKHVVLICGSRSLVDGKVPFSKANVLFAIEHYFPVPLTNVEVITGGAKGVDSIAIEWAKRKGIPYRVFRPNWKRYGKRAGLIRNEQMVRIATHVLALWDGVSNGTAHTIVTAHKYGVPVTVNLVKGKDYSIWHEVGKVDAICVTTNGFVTRSGRAVMGRGVAYQAKVFVPNVEKILAHHIKKFGNVPGQLTELKYGTKLVSFPVKKDKGIYPCPVVGHARNRFREGDEVPGFLLQADLDTIKRSADKLAEMIESAGWEKVILPKPGCGAGELNWNDVLETLVESKLSEVSSRVYIADKTGKKTLSKLIIERNEEMDHSQDEFPEMVF